MGFALGGLLLTLGSTPAWALRGHTFQSFGEEGTGNGQLKEPAGVAVRDSNGDVSVVDQGNDRVESFSPGGAYISQFTGSETPGGDFSSPEGIAIDNSLATKADPSAGDVYVVDAGHEVVDKFSPKGKYISQMTGTAEGPFGALDGVGVDPDGVVWVDQASGQIDSFSDGADNTFLSSTASPASTVPGFAVDSDEDFYLVTSEHKLTKLSNSGATLIESFDSAANSAAVAVEPASDDVYVDDSDSIGRFTSLGAPIERFGSPQLESGAGLAVYPQDGAVYVSNDLADQVDVFTPEPVSSPSVGTGSVYVTNVTEGSADLHATIDPDGADTTYYFQYGTASCVASPASCTSVPAPPGTKIGSSFEAQAVDVHVDGLQPNTTYFYRVVAINGSGSVEGHSESQSFITPRSAGPFALPDGRVYELVSPPDKHGGVLEPPNPLLGGGSVQAAAEGGAITYLSDQSPLADPEGEANDSQLLSSRGAEGWSTQDISAPHRAPSDEGLGLGSEYRLFSPDLSLGLLIPLENGDGTPLAPQASERTPYLRDDDADTCDVESSEGTCYTPLVTPADVPTGTRFNGDPASVEGAVKFVSATPDMSHVVLSAEAPVALTATSVEGGAGDGLYEWTAGALQLVSLLPQAEGGAAVSGLLGYQGHDVRHAISDDGSRIFWQPASGLPHLYMRDTNTHETLKLDIVQSGASGEGPVNPIFQGASTEGSKVFFTDEQQLTEGSSAAEGQADLYECEVIEAEGKPLCRLQDLTRADNAGESAEVQQLVPGISEDGSYLYLVAKGVLSNSANQRRVSASAGADNLYVLHSNGTRWERPTFIATLSEEDGPDWGAESSAGNLGGTTSRVSPSGRYFTFMSQQSLTGYDNRDASSGQPDEEVFVYDAQENRLACASCNPTGARPHGLFISPEGEFLVEAAGGPNRVWTGRWLAGSIPKWNAEEVQYATYQPRYLDNEGRLFFNSPDRLVPQAVNGKEDVYESEPPGVGSCTEPSETFIQQDDGCVSLISSGRSSQESAFLDASESGGEVFFLTAEALSPQDVDEQYDVYDAHECTTASACASAPVTDTPLLCTTTVACRPTASPPPAIFAAPASATFSGAGNVVQPPPKPASTPKPLTRAQKLARALEICRREQKKHRALCERRARQTYGPHHRTRRDDKSHGGRAS